MRVRSVLSGCPLSVACALARARRALKTKGNTPKYGLIFHSSFIGRAKQRNKVGCSAQCALCDMRCCMMPCSVQPWPM